MAEALKPGDKVAFLNSEGGGKVIALLDDDNLMIELDEGFEVPVNRNEVVKERDFTSPGQPSEPAAAPGSPDKTSLFSDEPHGAFLAFDQSKSKEVLDLYVVNHSHFSLYFQVFEKPGDQPYRGLSRGQLEAFSYQMINRYHTSEFEAWPVIVTQGLFFTDRTEDLPDPFVYTFKPKPKAFFNAVRTAPVLESPAHLFQVDQTKPAISGGELLEQKEPGSVQVKLQGTEGTRPETILERPPEVIDLHIDRLVPDYEKLERDSIISYQMTHFEENLDKAIAHNYSRLIFIHGVGNGVLRERIHRKLQQKPEVRSYKEADSNRYGYGATEVRLNQETQ